MSMFFISAVLKVRSQLGLEETASIVARALDIPPFAFDESGRYEEQDMFLSQSFGLEFGFCHPIGARPDEYELSMIPSDDFDYDGSEKEVDATAYTLALLSRAKGIEAFPG